MMQSTPPTPESELVARLRNSAIDYRGRSCAYVMTDAAAAIERLHSRNSELVQSLDVHLGTPCEQIRHAQEVEDLRAQLSGAYCSVCGSTDGLGCGACPEPSSAHEQGRREVVALATYVCNKSETLTDGPQRADWQAGYAAACREIRDTIRSLSSAPPGEDAYPDLTDEQFAAIKASVADLNKGDPKRQKIVSALEEAIAIARSEKQPARTTTYMIPVAREKGERIPSGWVGDAMVARANAAYAASIQELYAQAMHGGGNLGEIQAIAMRAALRAALAKEETP